MLKSIKQEKILEKQKILHERQQAQADALFRLHAAEQEEINREALRTGLILVDKL